jgi:mono/diheme cytochrome c family protein
MKSRYLIFLACGALTFIGAACSFNSVQETIPADWEQTSYIERGNYLVNYLGHCAGCHTPLDPDGQSDMSLYLSGVPAKYAGTKVGRSQVAGFPGPGGARFYAANLTPDPKTGLGRWSEEQFVRTFKHGVRPDGAKYSTSPMEWNIYANMKEDDVRAIYRYLRTIKAIPNKVPANIPPK